MSPKHFQRLLDFESIEKPPVLRLSIEQTNQVCGRPTPFW